MAANLLRVERCLQAQRFVLRELGCVRYRKDAAIATSVLWRTSHYVNLQLAVVVNFAAKLLQ